MSLDKDLHASLDALDQASMRRRLRRIEALSAGRAMIDGRSVTVFSSNDYLGLAHHPEVREAARNAIERWGTGAGSSRLLSGTFAAHEELEGALAEFLERDAALVFPSGYMANLAVITSLVGPGDAVVADRLCHASILDAIRLSGARLFVYAHGDLTKAELALERAKTYPRSLLVTESLFSMDGDAIPVLDACALAKRYGAVSIVDEAHALGVWGPEGRGFAGGAADVVVGTLSKSFASQGGFVAASRPLIEWIINKGRSFIFTTALAPGAVGAARQALRIARADEPRRRRVQALAAHLRGALDAQGWRLTNSQSHIVPVWAGEASRAVALAAELWQDGIWAPAIRPPTVHAGECRLRFSVTADHSEADLDHLAQRLARQSALSKGD